MSASAIQVVPLQPVPNQAVNVTLNNQACAIDVYEKQVYVPYQPEGAIPTDPPPLVQVSTIYVDLYVNDSLIIGGVLARNNNLIVRDAYLGFVGDVYFVDTQGDLDPQVAGLGSRWVLVYNPSAP